MIVLAGITGSIALVILAVQVWSNANVWRNSPPQSFFSSRVEIAKPDLKAVQGLNGQPAATVVDIVRRAEH